MALYNYALSINLGHIPLRMCGQVFEAPCKPPGPFIRPENLVKNSKRVEKNCQLSKIFHKFELASQVPIPNKPQNIRFLSD